MSESKFYPPGESFRIQFKFDYREVDQVAERAKSERHLKNMESLAKCWPAWNTNFDLIKGIYVFDFRAKRTSIRQSNGYPNVEIGHADDAEFATYLTAEIMQSTGIKAAIVSSTDVKLARRMEAELKNFGIKIDGVVVDKPVKGNKEYQEEGEIHD